MALPGVPAEPALRPIAIDLDAVGQALDAPELSGRLALAYDYEAMIRPLTPQALAAQPEEVVAVRLLVSEVGADRLLASENGLLEAVGVLYTVRNRLEPSIYDPEARGVRPYEGCGPEGDFVSCAEPDQYLGLDTWRALDPTSRYDPSLLAAAADLAWTAWLVQAAGLAPDPTGGATCFVHRCGGDAYGASTRYCDGDPAVPDQPGADPVTGPILFRGPGAFSAAGGYYRNQRYAEIDYLAAPERGADEPAPALAGEASDTGLAALPD